LQGAGLDQARTVPKISAAPSLNYEQGTWWFIIWFPPHPWSI
jgi:hypothetical protein